MINFFRTYLHQFGLVNGLRLLLMRIVRRLLDRYQNEYYSQTGEDIIIDYILDKPKGFYIDVGCHHPVKISKTYRLYKKGWTGLNIDANPNLIKEFRRIRPRDISRCDAISNIKEERTFYEFHQDAVSTINQSVLEEWKMKWDLKSERTVDTKTLNQILEEENISRPIDLLSIDVEGHDYQVLSSMDLSKHKPYLIIIEMHNFDIIHPDDNQIYRHLIENQYRLIGYVLMNGYFLYSPEIS